MKNVVEPLNCIYIKKISIWRKGRISIKYIVKICQSIHSNNLIFTHTDSNSRCHSNLSTDVIIDVKSNDLGYSIYAGKTMIYKNTDFVVERRNKNILIPIIQGEFLPGTTYSYR